MQPDEIRRRIVAVEGFLMVWEPYCDLVYDLYHWARKADVAAKAEWKQFVWLIDDLTEVFASDMIDDYGDHWVPPVRLRRGSFVFGSCEDTQPQLTVDLEGDGDPWWPEEPETDPVTEQKTQLRDEARGYRLRLRERLKSLEDKPASDALSGGPFVVLPLKRLAYLFDFSNPQKFRKAMLDSGRLPHQRLSRSRYKVSKRDLPEEN